MLIPKTDRAAASRRYHGERSRQDDGSPRKCLANVLHVLSLHPAWEGVIAYDAFGECVVKQRTGKYVETKDRKMTPRKRVLR